MTELLHGMPSSGEYVEPRQEWLDWLRAVAIALVLGSHYQINWHDVGIFRPWAQFNARVGWSGVDMFFVISGFLIGGLLISEVRRYGAVDLRRFYLRRGTKIWPLLYLVPLLYILVSPLLYGSDRQTALWLSLPTFFHVQNYFPLPLGHLWSLAVEEHFYLLLPISIVLTYRVAAAATFFRRFSLLLLASIVLIFALRCHAAAIGVAPTAIRLLTHYRLDSLMIGVLLACVLQFRPDWWVAITRHRFWLVALAVVCAWPFAFNANESAVLAGPGFTSLAVMYSAILMLVSTLASKRPIGLPRKMLTILAWIGRRSYPIYLFHPFFWALILKIGIINLFYSVDGNLRALVWLTGLIIFYGISILSGALIGDLLEKPLLALRDRMFPPRARALPVDGVFGESLPDRG